MKTNKDNAYIAVYLKNGKWLPCLATTKELAQQQHADLLKAGYKNYIYKYSDYLAIGGPDNE